MAEGEDRPGRTPEEASAEEQHDVVDDASRKIKTYTRRAVLGGLLGLGALSTKTGRRLASVSLEKIGIMDNEIKPVYDLPPFPEFQPPDSDQRLLVVLLKAKGETEPASRDEIAEDVAEVAEQYRFASYDNMLVTSSVHDWLEIEFPKDRDLQDVIAQRADAKLRAKGLDDWQRFQTRLYVYRSDKKPEYGGLAFSSIGGNGYKRALAYIGGNSKGERGGFKSVVRHEFGHIIGLPHANSVTGKNHTEEYGGIDDFMGKTENLSSYGSLTAVQAVALGWIPREKVQDITKDGVYNLADVVLGDPVAGRDNRYPLALRLQKPDTNERIYIGYRHKGEPIKGLHPFNPDVLMQASQLEIHRWNERRESDPVEILNSFVRWDDGNEYYDKKNGIRIRQMSHVLGSAPGPEASTVKLQVTFDKR